MKVKFSEMGTKHIEDFPEDTVFVWDTRPVKRDPVTLRCVFPGDPDYDTVKDPRFEN